MKLNLHTREELEEFAKNIRRDIVRMTHNSGVKGAHLGGSMSIVEIMAVLYGSVMNYDSDNPSVSERDRVIISKAHAAMTLYSALSYSGFINREIIDTAMHGKSPLYEHPKKSPQMGIECSGGSLGMGLSFAVGMALGLKRSKNDTSRVFVIVGDGECNEGSMWEAATALVHYGLKNIVTIVDRNKLQYDGTTAEVMGAGSLRNRWESVGFDVIETDGHDVMKLKEVLEIRYERPTVIIADTVKGKGTSFAENRVEWHSEKLTDEMMEQALSEII